MAVRSSWFCIKSSIYLLIFHLVVLSIIESTVLTSPIIIAELNISPFNSVKFCFVHFSGQLVSVQVFIIFSWCIKMHFTWVPLRLDFPYLCSFRQVTWLRKVNYPKKEKKKLHPPPSTCSLGF